jgi:tetratricopeptide (TPR) repeat protein
MPVSISPAIAHHFEAVRRELEARGPLWATAELELLLQSEPRFAAARRLLGLCLAEQGDAVGAERELRQALVHEKRQPMLHTDLGDLLASLDRPAEAERAYRAALALDRRWLDAAVGLSRLLGRQGRMVEAVQITTPLVSGPNPPPPALEAHTRALFAAGRLEDALASSRRAVAAGVPEAELGTAQILDNLGRHAEAETVYRDLVARQPGDERAIRGLTRAVFARTSDPDQAKAVVDEALARRWTPSLVAFQATMLNRANRSPEAYALAQDAVRRLPGDAMLQATAATAAALSHQYEAAYGHAERARALAPDHDEIEALLAETSLSAGRPELAAHLIDGQRRRRPLDQKLIALDVLAKRLLGDQRYRDLHDYDRFVRAFTIEPPRGWSTLEAFLADLRARLHAIHDGLGETMDNSLRHGTQTTINLARTNDPILKALFSALDKPIAAHVAELGRSDDPLLEPLRARNTGGHAYDGAWSVRLRPGVGHHVNHIHTDGWLSSAFYVDLPSVMQESAGREGWIKFGEPGVPTSPVLEAEHYVQPQPGRLVLFPSYMWHGTIPFSGNERRLTFAFDVVPAPALKR